MADRVYYPPPRPRRRRRNRIAFLVLSLYWLALFVATHLPPSKLPHVTATDKTLHYVAYAGLAVLTGASLSLVIRLTFWRLTIAGALLATYAAIDEVTQSLVGRSTDIQDWFADAAGIITGLVIAFLLRWLFDLIFRRNTVRQY